MMKYNIKNFTDGDFYDTDDLEDMSKEKLVYVTEHLQRQLSEAQRIIGRIKIVVSEYDELYKI